MGFRSLFGNGGAAAAYAALLLKTGQTTSYHVGDDGDYEKGVAKAYTVNSTGAQAGTTNVDVPHYAAATLAFVSADKKITDSANGLAIFKTGETIKVHGSGLNDGVYTVATGNVAGEIVTTEALVDESAGAIVTLYKRAAVSNNTVLDTNTGLTWLRYATGGPVQKVGYLGNGKLNYIAIAFTLHAAAGDLQMIAASKTLKIVGGAAEVTRYAAGMIIQCAGFANTANNLRGQRIESVTVNGADLDLVLWTGTTALVNEVAAGSRSISIICQSVFAYCAAANLASLGGYTDWRVPEDVALKSLCKMEGSSDALPDATAFPSWSGADMYWSSSGSPPSRTTSSMLVSFYWGNIAVGSNNAVGFCALVRGG